MRTGGPRLVLAAWAAIALATPTRAPAEPSCESGASAARLAAITGTKDAKATSPASGRDASGAGAKAPGSGDGGPVDPSSPASATPVAPEGMVWIPGGEFEMGALDGDEVRDWQLFTDDTIDAAGADIAERFRGGASGTAIDSGPHGARVVSIFAPTDRFVIAGGGPIAEAIGAAAALQGWQVSRAGDVDTATGLMVGLTPGDMVVVMGHDVELSSRMLAAALASEAGYIGALGSQKMQSQRADWLAYQGITDLDRVNGPAGLAIGAESPAEIAVSILAQVIAVRNL